MGDRANFVVVRESGEHELYLSRFGAGPRPGPECTSIRCGAGTNLAVEVDEEAGTATARSYVTVFQSLPELPLQPVVCGRYQDRFERRDGQWRFTERRFRATLVGDVSRHLRGSG
ncbi:nuclear transport factor 2 family protein [Kitasatospora griseola]|uniref:nuclear transport factor 2 family protein n=1 Tax=Kitasatospora griseola TaxID=2064 RepID=UPI00382F7F8C